MSVEDGKACKGRSDHDVQQDAQQNEVAEDVKQMIDIDSVYG